MKGGVNKQTAWKANIKYVSRYLQGQHSDKCRQGTVVGDDNRVGVNASGKTGVVSDHVHLGTACFHLNSWVKDVFCS